LGGLHHQYVRIKVFGTHTKAAIADRYRAHDAQRLESKIPVIACLRISELERYLDHRYGLFLPDDDAGRADLVILLNHVAMNRNDPCGKMLGSIGRWAPWMDATEARSLCDKILQKPRRYKATTLGRLLRLTEEEQDLLQITTIRAFDMTDEDMLARKRSRDRKAKKAKRAANSSGRGRGRPKSEGPQPWEAAGASSESAHYRNRKKAAVGGTKNASPPLEGDSYADDGISVPRESVVQLQARSLTAARCIGRLSVSPPQ
jgi:hypothetical protein